MRCYLLLILCWLLPAAVLRAQYDTLITFYPGGKKESVIPLYNSTREGVARWYYESGALKQELTYNAGRIEGTVKILYENGNTQEIFTLVNGRREGAASYYTEDGQLRETKYFTEGKADTALYKPAPVKDTVLVAAQPEEKKKETTTKKQEPQVLADTSAANDTLFYTDADLMPVPVKGERIFYEKLVYPERALKNKTEGTVIVRAYIDKTGEVLQTEVLKRIGNGCDEAAEICVYYTKFKPAVLRGKKVNARKDITIEFRLPEPKQ